MDNQVFTSKTDLRMKVDVLVPGYKVNELRVRSKVVDDGDYVVIVRGRPRRRGRVFGYKRKKFTEKISVPAEFKIEGLTATLKRGVLTLDIPRTDESRGQKIDISTNGPVSSEVAVDSD